MELARIDRLVRDLLDFAAPNSEEQELLDPVDVVTEACGLLSQQGALDEVAVSRSLPEGLAKVRVSRHKLLQVFVNLLLNARDACREAGTVCVEAGLDGDQIRITVTDDGCGMQPGQLPHVFDPFYTTKAPGKGRGLGLAVCHRIIEEVDGSIAVASRPGEGSTFTVTLPVAEGDG